MLTIIAKILAANLIIHSFIVNNVTTVRTITFGGGTGVRIEYNYAGEEISREEIVYDKLTNEWIVKD